MSTITVSPNALQGKKLEAGGLAPEFETTDLEGRPIKLREYQGSNTLLVFFRNASCPFCNLHLFQLIKARHELQAQGIQLLFVFESSEKKLKKSRFYAELEGTPIISDPESTLYTLYGVEKSWLKMMATPMKSEAKAKLKEAKNAYGITGNGMEKGTNANRVPADFFLDENLKVVKAHYGKDLSDHVPIPEVKSLAAAYASSGA